MSHYSFFIRGDTFETMFYDFKNLNNVSLYSNNFNIKSKLLNLLCKIHNSRRINVKIPLPFRGIWNKYAVVNNVSYDETHYIVFFNSTVVQHPKKYLRALANKKNTKLILICLDTMQDKLLGVLDYIKSINFHAVYSFDPKDIAQYHFLPIFNYYSKLPIPNGPITNDLFFIGGNKGRMKALDSLYSKAVEYNVRTKYFLFAPKGESMPANKDITILSQRMDYEESLNHLSSSQCILELLSGDQTGQTLRYYEAVCYNKKLLTNNKNIVNLPYYDERYMQYFSSVEDIDFEWIKRPIIVDYHYKNDFSPIKLLEQIEKDCNDCIYDEQQEIG